MHPFLKWSLAAAVIALTLAFLVPGLVWLQSEAVIERRYPLPSTTAAAISEARAVSRGAHLIAIGGCSDCHGANLEGRLLREGTLPPIWSSNLRLLAHSSTDEEFERALRTGIRADSTSTWVMPAMDYAYMSEDDVVAIISYLRTLKAAGATAPPPQFDMAARFAIARGDIEPIAERVEESPSSLDLGPRYDGGRYLARIACSDCHGTDLTGISTIPGLVSVARYSRSDFFALMRAGRAPEGKYLPDMSKPRFRALYDYEIDALYDYLSARAQVLTPHAANMRSPSIPAK